ncbi:MAG: hypothetical protein NT096_12380 [Proteobacteria bacterium]|nr:hypothetical protein [Pseudomonadota bacterium]
MRQVTKLDNAYIFVGLQTLCELKENPEIVERLRKTTAIEHHYMPREPAEPVQLQHVQELV